MKWLLWKDICLNRALFILAAVGWFVPYVLAWLVSPGSWFVKPIPAGNLVVAAIWSLVLVQLPMAFVGGNAVAGERIDRSAEFLNSLPVSRRRIVSSKLLVMLGATAMVWIPNLVVLASATPFLTPANTIVEQFLPWVRTTLSVGLAMMSVAWLASTLMRSPVFATCMGFLAPAIAFQGGFLLLWLMGYNPVMLSYAWYRGLCLVVALASLLVGARCYLQRVEP